MAAISTRTLVESIMNKIISKCLLTTVLLILVQLSTIQVVNAQVAQRNSAQISNAQPLTLQVEPFTQVAFDEMKAKYQGNKWLTLLWSVDCPPCMKELALVQKLQQQTKDIAVVIINVDTYENSEQQRDEILLHFDLTQRKHFHFQEDLEDQSRYHIDPQWFGELPRSYFIDEAGIFHGKSGLVSKELLSKWLLTPSH
jgi:thiol-disulfide isomerase/thioredoxin